MNIAHRRSCGSIASAVHGDAEMMCDWNMQEPALRSQTLNVRSSETCTAKLAQFHRGDAAPPPEGSPYRAQPYAGPSCATLTYSAVAATSAHGIVAHRALIPIIGAVVPIIGAVIPMISILIPSITSASQLA